MFKVDKTLDAKNMKEFDVVVVFDKIKLQLVGWIHVLHKETFQ
jgi:hypothetical protein